MKNKHKTLIAAAAMQGIMLLVCRMALLGM